MKRLVQTFAIATALVAALAQQSYAQDSVAQKPGYFTLDTKTLLGGRSPQVQLSLPKALIQVALAATAESQPELAELLGSIDLIQVQVYDAESTPETTVEAPPAPADPSVSTKFKATVDTMQNDGWLQILKVEEDKVSESVHGFAKTGEHGNILGLTLFVNDLPETFVFINIVGNIPGQVLGAAMQGGMKGLPDMDVMNQLSGLLQQSMGQQPPPPPPPSEKKASEADAPPAETPAPESSGPAKSPETTAP